MGVNIYSRAEGLSTLQASGLRSSTGSTVSGCTVEVVAAAAQRERPRPVGAGPRGNRHVSNIVNFRRKNLPSLVTSNSVKILAKPFRRLFAVNATVDWNFSMSKLISEIEEDYCQHDLFGTSWSNFISKKIECWIKCILLL